MSDQTLAYWINEASYQAHVRHFYMDEARWARDQNEAVAVEWAVSMADDASWRVRWAKRQARKMQQVAA